jgi:hypothetical protein
MTEHGERARLEAIVFGREDAATDAERDAARAELARLIAEDEAAAQLRVPPVADPGALETPASDALDRASPAVAEPAGPIPDPVQDRRARRTVAIRGGAIIGGLAVLSVVAAAGLGRGPFAPADSLAIFDRPQTEEDKAYAAELIDPNVDLDSVRFVGEKAGYEVYVYRAEPPAGSPDQTLMACMGVRVDEFSTGGACTFPAEFSDAGLATRFESDGIWTDVSWSIRSGVVVTTGTHPPIPSPLSVFDEPQDDVDREELLFLPELRPDLQGSARFLGTNGAYSVLAYRGDDDEVCLAVYQRSTTRLTAESACADETTFEREGIALLYPASAPEAEVSWGPGPGITVSGR